MHTQFADPPGGILNPAGLPQIVGVDRNEPDHLPNQQLLDLHIEKAFGSFGYPTGKLSIVLDGFNIFNSATPLNTDVIFNYGQVTSIPTARRFRVGVRYEF